MKSIYSLALFSLLGFLLSAAEIRPFKDSAGRIVEASFMSSSADQVSLKLKSGKIAVIPLSKLSKQDQEYIKAEQTKANLASDGINKALGFNAFSSVNITECVAEEMAKAMKLPLESDSPVGKSWRFYAAVRKPGYKLFDAVPYSVALYSNSQGMLDSISIVFANKGDYGSTVGFGEDHFKESGQTKTSLSLLEAMERDTETITRSIASALGEPKKQRYGDSGTRRSVNRWDWNGYAFLLSHVENEYVSLMVVASERADMGGRSASDKDAVVRARLLSSVKTEDDGDVFIAGIPMVDQGPKGYCVPATFERAMRFMGMEADMYLIAMVGETQVGGGTSVELLIDNLRSQVYRKGRRLKESKNNGLRIRDVKRDIDAGIPLLWRMCSTQEYNSIANENTKKREQGAQGGHGAFIQECRQLIADREKPDESHHLCMIIGYNEKTGELAVSDSWGQHFALRWVPIEVASWVDHGAIVKIEP